MNTYFDNVINLMYILLYFSQNIIHVRYWNFAFDIVKAFSAIASR